MIRFSAVHALVWYVLFNVSGICLCRTSNVVLFVVILGEESQIFLVFLSSSHLFLAPSPQNLLRKILDVAE